MKHASNDMARRRKNNSAQRAALTTLGVGIGLMTLTLTKAQANPPADFLNAALLGQADAPPTEANNGPTRLARFTYVQGNVTWRGADGDDWAGAATNMPLRQGAQIWVSDNSRAEIQFDDGSRLRLDRNTLVTLQTLFSDAQGEFTEINLNDGETDLRTNNKYSVYQINSPLSSVKVADLASVRIGAGDGLQIGVRRGSATVEGTADKATLHEGDYLDVTDANASYTVRNLPREDEWDRWNDARDWELEGYRTSATYRNLPPNVAIVADNLDAYGAWRDDPIYGRVWVPAVTEADWRPYYHGRWTWVEPFGWTWVGAEPWGWAPYHYGTWFHASYGWGWRPGPVTQYWSPAVVSFYNSGGSVAWCPLAPREVHYPAALSIGFSGGNWSAFFSIGQAAVYYPGARPGIFEPRPWRSNYVNRTVIVNKTVNVTNVTNVTNNYNNVTVNRNTFVRNNYIPANATEGGASSVSAAQFGRATTAYQPVSRAAVRTVFQQGQAVGAPATGRPVAGPSNVQATRASFSPTRTFQPAASVPRPLVTRSVYRAALPAAVRPTTARSGQSFVNSRPAITRGANPRTGNPAGTGRPAIGGRNAPAPIGGAPARNSGLDNYLRERNGGGVNGSNGSGGRTAPGGIEPGTGGAPERGRTAGTSPVNPDLARRPGQTPPRTAPGGAADRRPIHTGNWQRSGGRASSGASGNSGRNGGGSHTDSGRGGNRDNGGRDSGGHDNGGRGGR